MLGSLAVAMVSISVTAADKAENKKKLKIVFMMGQSNMVGYAAPRTAWYLTRPMYIPPAKMATAKPRFYPARGSSFYWSGLLFAQGDSEEYNARGAELLQERRASRKLWRSRVYGADTGYKNDWKGWKKEWGPRPGKNGEGWRRDMYNFLDHKAEEEGIYKRMEEHIESPENKLHPKMALAKLGERDALIADDIKRVREIFLKGTKPEDFDKMAEAEAALKAEMKAKKLKGSPFKNRLEYAEFLKKHVGLPIAERTYIAAAGELRQDPLPEGKDIKQASGRLTVGWGQNWGVSGPEYPFGISFERMVDGPVLIVKVAIGGTSLQQSWRPTSLANAETPKEEAAREAKGAEKNIQVGPLWTKALGHIKEVLADPGKFHPDYDPKAGVELAGLVWFQGWNDMGNPAYGEQLVHFIKDFRKEVGSPGLPVVCGLLGHNGWAMNTFSGNVNSGMLYASKHADLKGTVDIVNTLPYMPLELGFGRSLEAAFGKESEEYKKAASIIGRAVSKDGTHYFGSAKFVYLTGDAMARKLVNLLKGGKPTIHEEAEGLGI